MKIARVYLEVATIVFGVLGILSFAPSLFSLTMFDAPGSTENPATILLFCSAFTFPVVCGIAIVLARTLYKSTASRWACLLIHLPLINIICGVIAMYWLDIAYGGKFDG